MLPFAVLALAWAVKTLRLTRKLIAQLLFLDSRANTAYPAVKRKHTVLARRAIDPCRWRKPPERGQSNPLARRATHRVERLAFLKTIVERHWLSVEVTEPRSCGKFRSRSAIHFDNRNYRNSSIHSPRPAKFLHVSPSGLMGLRPAVRWLTPPAEICRPPGFMVNGFSATVNTSERNKNRLKSTAIIRLSIPKF